MNLITEREALETARARANTEHRPIWVFVSAGGDHTTRIDPVWNVKGWRRLVEVHPDRDAAIAKVEGR